jgi:hypothetical protein
MQIHRKINFTPFPVDIGFCQDCEGRDLVVALLKETFRFTPKGEVFPADKDGSVPVFLRIVFWAMTSDSSSAFSGRLLRSWT